MTDSSIEKRVRRIIRGREQKFFAVYPPGFEEIALSEVSALSGVSDVVGETGGVSFTGKIPVLYAANLRLRGAVRVLMRIDEFHAENFRELKRKASAIPWELYLYNDTALSFSISCRHSRLYHTGAIEETLREAIVDRAFADGGSGEQTIFVRFDDDRCTISIDSSGDPLYRRGFKLHVNDAPLRENVAAMILRRAGIASFNVVLDPMCGSGTFALEAACAAGKIPQFAPTRSFAVEQWPVFSADAFGYEKRSAAIAPQNIQLFASDVDDRSLSAARHNFDAAFLSPDAKNGVSLSSADFFSLDRRSFGEGKMLIVFNPPYGKRIEAEDLLFRNIAAKLKNDFSADAAAVVVPVENCSAFADFDRLLSFSNGGIDVALLTRNII